MKKFLVGVLAVLLVLVGTLLPVLRPRPSRVTEENMDRIKEGMTRPEVEAILGPPGDYRTGPTVGLSSGGSMVPGDTLLEWQGDEVDVGVGFAAGRVTAVRRWDVLQVNVGPVERLRWRWDRWRESLFK